MSQFSGAAVALAAFGAAAAGSMGAIYFGPHPEGRVQIVEKFKPVERIVAKAPGVEEFQRLYDDCIDKTQIQISSQTGSTTVTTTRAPADAASFCSKHALVGIGRQVWVQPAQPPIKLRSSFESVYGKCMGDYQIAAEDDDPPEIKKNDWRTLRTERIRVCGDVAIKALKWEEAN